MDGDEGIGGMLIPLHITTFYLDIVLKYIWF